MRAQKGLGLIEVLIALFIQMLGVVMLSALFIKAQRASENAYYHSLATTAAYSLVERLMANPESGMQQRELSAWQAEIPVLLPEGSGQYDCQLSTCSATLTWQTRELQQKTIIFPRDIITSRA